MDPMTRSATADAAVDQPRVDVQRGIFRFCAGVEEMFLTTPARAKEEERLVELQEAHIALAVRKLWGRVAKRRRSHFPSFHRVPKDRALWSKENPKTSMWIVDDQSPSVVKALEIWSQLRNHGATSSNARESGKLPR